MPSIPAVQTVDVEGLEGFDVTSVNDPGNGVFRGPLGDAPAPLDVKKMLY